MQKTVAMRPPSRERLPIGSAIEGDSSRMRREVTPLEGMKLGPAPYLR
jgi:hypothetical protein